VAFKLIRAGRAEADADRLHREAEVVARLQHPNLGVAEIHAFRGEAALAFEWLARSFSQRQPSLRDLKYDPWLRPLQSDQRWKALLQKMNLPAD
jgi:hypothetical protein